MPRCDRGGRGSMEFAGPGPGNCAAADAAPELVEDSMPRVNADYIDLTASARLFDQPLPRNRRLPELGLWPAVGKGRSCVGRRAQPQQHRRIRRGHRLPERLRLREHLLGHRRHSAAGQREGLVVRIGWRQRGSCRAVEQSLPLRPAAARKCRTRTCRLRLSRSTIRTSSPSRAASTGFMDRRARRSG